MNRETAAKWMETIHDDLRNTYIQDDLFWQFQDVVRENGTLADSQNVFLYWVNTLFKDSIIMAVRRQIDRDQHCVSLWRLPEEFRDDPTLAGGRFTVPDIQMDIDSLDQPAQMVRGFAEPGCPRRPSTTWRGPADLPGRPQLPRENVRPRHQIRCDVMRTTVGSSAARVQYKHGGRCSRFPGLTSKTTGPIRYGPESSRLLKLS